MGNETMIKITVFWDVAPCSLYIDRRFRGAYCIIWAIPEDVIFILAAVRS
jgi:hypothetical protein